MAKSATDPVYGPAFLMVPSDGSGSSYRSLDNAQNMVQNIIRAQVTGGVLVASRSIGSTPLLIMPFGLDALVTAINADPNVSFEIF